MPGDSPTDPEPPPEAPREASRSWLTRIRTAWAGWPGTILRILFAVLPVAWLAQVVRPEQVLRQIAQGGLGTFGTVLALQLVSLLVASLRWRLLLGAYGSCTTPDLWALLRHNLVGIYYGTLPGGVAGDAIRGYRVRHSLSGLAASYTVILVDRLVGLLALLIIAVAAGAPGGQLLEGGVFTVLDVTAGAWLALVLVVFVVPYVLQRDSAARFVRRLSPALGRLLGRIPPPRSLGGVLAGTALSFPVQATPIINTYLICRGIATGTGLWAIARVVPFIIILTMIPLTPVGIGQREMIAVYFFDKIGISADAAVAISLFGFSILLAIAGLGGLCLLLEKSLSRRSRSGGP